MRHSAFEVLLKESDRIKSGPHAVGSIVTCHFRRSTLVSFTYNVATLGKTSENVMASRFYRQRCYLCDLPHTPWAMLTDFTEPICRGCCNYEGASRIKYVIENVRNVRKIYDIEKEAKGPLVVGFPHPGIRPVHGIHREEKPRLVRETLAALNMAAPFDLRFKNDTSLHARAVYFSVFNKSRSPDVSDIKMKIVIEYPYGSGIYIQSATGATKQMQNDSPLKDVVKSSPASGYKALEYEKVHGCGEWITLGDLISKRVRYFREPVNQELIPIPYRGDEMDNSSTVINRSNPQNQRKRRGTRPKLEAENEATLAKQAKAEGKEVSFRGNKNSKGSLANMNLSSSNPTTAISSAPMVLSRPRNQGIVETAVESGKASPSVAVPEHSRLHNGLASEGIGDNDRKVSTASAVEKNPSIGAVKDQQTNSVTPIVSTCALCNGKIEDTDFVRCPSVPHHDFCCPCSLKSIISQKSASAEVFCPSGERCTDGSNLPWAFMPEEITKIEHYVRQSKATV